MSLNLKQNFMFFTNIFIKTD